MGDEFVAGEYWTSPHRIRAGLSPLVISEDTSTITLKDASAIWTKAMAASGYSDAGAWLACPPTWHIEVKTTRGHVGEDFTLSAAQFEKVQPPSRHYDSCCIASDLGCGSVIQPSTPTNLTLRESDRVSPI